jgi:CheY-like chemotaxis protein
LAYWFVYLRPQKVVKTEPQVQPRILVVDDDPDFTEIARLILTKEGYRVATATDGTEALQAMKDERPDLVLLDVVMATPLDGVQVSRQMATDLALKSIPIIMVSAIDSGEHAALLPDDVHIPIDAWISKPADPDHLLRTIQRFLA